MYLQRWALLSYQILLSITFVHSHTKNGNVVVCRGDGTKLLKISCDKDEMIAINNGYYGIKSKPTDTSCSPNASDNKVIDGPIKDIISTCSGMSTCHDYSLNSTVWKIENSHTPAYYNVHYTCVSAQDVLNVCNASRSDRHNGYISSPGYPGYSFMDQCSCEFNASNSNMEILIKHMNMSESNAATPCIATNNNKVYFGSSRLYDIHLNKTDLLTVDNHHKAGIKFWIHYKNVESVRCRTLSKSSKPDNKGVTTASFPSATRENTGVTAASSSTASSTHLTSSPSHTSKPTTRHTISTLRNTDVDTTTERESTSIEMETVGRTTSDTDLTTPTTFTGAVHKTSTLDGATGYPDPCTDGISKSILSTTQAAVTGANLDFTPVYSSEVPSETTDDAVTIVNVTSTDEYNNTRILPIMSQDDIIIFSAALTSVAVGLLFLVIGVLFCLSRKRKAADKGKKQLLSPVQSFNINAAYTNESENANSDISTPADIQLDDITDGSPIVVSDDMDVNESHTNVAFECVYSSVPDGLYSRAYETALPWSASYVTDSVTPSEDIPLASKASAQNRKHSNRNINSTRMNGSSHILINEHFTEDKYDSNLNNSSDNFRKLVGSPSRRRSELHVNSMYGAFNGPCLAEIFLCPDCDETDAEAPEIPEKVYMTTFGKKNEDFSNEVNTKFLPDAVFHLPQTDFQQPSIPTNHITNMTNTSTNNIQYSESSESYTNLALESTYSSIPDRIYNHTKDINVSSNCSKIKNTELLSSKTDSDNSIPCNNNNSNEMNIDTQNLANAKYNGIPADCNVFEDLVKTLKSSPDERMYQADIDALYAKPNKRQSIKSSQNADLTTDVNEDLQRPPLGYDTNKFEAGASNVDMQLKDLKPDSCFHDENPHVDNPTHMMENSVWRQAEVVLRSRDHKTLDMNVECGSQTAASAVP